MTGALTARAFVLGAGGEPGAAIALMLARAGWPLVLQDDGGYRMRSALRRHFRALNADAIWCACDPGATGRVDSLVRLAQRHGPVSLVVCADRAGEYEPPGQVAARIRDPLAELVAALSGPNIRWVLIDDAGGCLVPLATSADVDAIRLQVADDVVPGELAEAVGQAISLPSGTYDVRPAAGLCASTFTQGAQPTTSPPGPDAMDGGEVTSRLAELARRLLTLEPTVALNGGGLGMTHGWDSMKQIEIVLAAERAFGVRFQTAEISALKRFDDLAACIAAKVTGKASRMAL